MADFEIVILDDTAKEIDRCLGPAPDGSCPRVARGDLVPCAGNSLLPAGSTGQPYAVPETLTLCPVTLAHSLAVGSDEPFDD